MTKIKLGYKIIALLLCFSMLITVIPADVMGILAEAFSGDSVSQETDQKKKDLEIIGEVVSKREENVKHFRLSDGSFLAADYGVPVHYKNGNEWDDIDNSLQENKNNKEQLINKSNRFQTAFPKQMQPDGGITVSDGDYALSFKIDGAKTTAGTQKQAVSRNQAKTKIEKQSALKNISSGMIYKNAFTGIDLSYSLSSDRLKEDIILNTRTSIDKINYTYTLKNLIVVQLDQRTLAFYDKADTKKLVFVLTAPYMMDAKGQYNENLSFEVSGKEDTVTVTLKLDTEWLMDENTVYPVTVDPVVESGQNPVYEAYVYEWSPTDSYSALEHTNVGVDNYQKEMRTLINFDNLPTLTSSDQIIWAKLKLTTYDEEPWRLVNNYEQAPIISAHQMTTSWNNTICWNTLWQTDRLNGFDSTVLDYQKIDAQGTYYWNITAAARQWYTNPATNYGLMLQVQNKSDYSSTAQIYFVSTDYLYTTSEQYTRAIINYYNSQGLEQEWQTLNYDLGRGGTADVNLYNGNLVYTHQDAATPGNIMPAGISHIFNSSLAGKQFTAGNAKTADYSDMTVGCGFKLNVQQSVVSTGITASPYVYTDGDGTEHYISAPNQDGKRLSEFGEIYELTFNNANESLATEMYLTDKQGNKMTFSKSLGRLLSLSDTKGKTTTIQYSGEKILYVTDGASQSLVLSYDVQNRLEKITDIAGRETLYSYIGDYLTRITYPDGQYTDFAYAYSQISSIITLNGVGCGFSYTNWGSPNTYVPRRISSVTQLGSGYVYGQQLGVNVSEDGTTVVRSSGADDVYGNTDDIYTTYCFDAQGKTISVYTYILENGRKVVKGAACAEYTSNEDANRYNANKLVSIAKTNGVVPNLLPNNNFTSTGYGWGSVVEDPINSPATCGYDGQTTYASNYSLYITKTNNTGKAYHHLNITPYVSSDKTYTASIYVGTHELGYSNTGGAFISVVSTGPLGEIAEVSSEKIFNYDGLPGSMGWARISVTFTTQANYQYSLRLNLADAQGTARFDGVSLQEGEVASTYNLIENAQFSYGTGSAERWTGNALSTGDGVVNNSDTDYYNAFKIVGKPNSQKYIYQNINTTYLSPAETFVVSGWAKGTSVGIDDKDVSDRSFKIKVVLYYADQTSQENDFQFHFEPNCSGWQYVSGVVVPKETQAYLTCVQVIASYEHNANIVYFRDLALGYTSVPVYRYDSNGNLTRQSLVGTNDKEMSSDSSGNVKVSVDETGAVSTSFYDLQNNLITSLSGKGYRTNYNYDAHGNIIQTKTAEEKRVKAIESGKTYHIRNKATGQYLTLYSGTQSDPIGEVQPTWYHAGVGAQEWKMLSTGTDGKYEIKADTGITNKSLDVLYFSNQTNAEVGGVVYSGGVNQKFELVPNDDLTYTIKTFTSDMVLAYGRPAGKTNDVLVQQTANSSDAQRWYVVEASEGQSGTIEADSTYYIRNVSNGKYMDVEGYNYSSGANVFSCVFNAGNNQQFKLVSAGAPNQYRLVAQHSGKAVTRTVYPDMNLLVSDYDENNPRQVFTITEGWVPGTFYITIDLPEISATGYAFANTDVYYYPVYQGEPEGLWVFEKNSNNIVVTSSTYSSDGRYKLSDTDEQGNVTEYAYDTDRGLVTSVTDESGTTGYGYDLDNDHLESVTSGGITVGYDYEGDRLKTITRNQTDYTFNYNGFGAFESLTVGPQGNTRTLVSNTYGPNNGKLLSSNLGAGEILYYNYDSLDRYTGYQQWGIPKNRIVYNDKDQIEKYFDFAGLVNYNYRYDAQGRLIYKGSTSTHPYLSIFSSFQKFIQYDIMGRVSGVISKRDNNTYKDYYYYDNKGQLSGTWNDEWQISTVYGYDALGRKTSYWSTDYLEEDFSFQQRYTYATPDSSLTTSKTSSLISRLTVDYGGYPESIGYTDDYLDYTYTSTNQIETISKNGALKSKYYYDSLGQVIRENSVAQNQTITYTYDAGGNITSKKVYAYTTAEDLSGLSYTETTWSYNDPYWKDLLTSYKGQTIEYDDWGRPSTYRDNMYLMWEARNLQIAYTPTHMLGFGYNADNIRWNKFVCGDEGPERDIYYILDDDKILAERDMIDSGRNIDYFYNPDGTLNYFIYNGAVYHYVYNAQGDIWRLYAGFTMVAEYEYDAWGNPTAIKDGAGNDVSGNASHIANINPFRYRGYYYDVETGFYYLQSRYYDPAIHRFVSMDDPAVLGEDQGSVMQYNLFAYCLNDPVTVIRRTTEKPSKIKEKRPQQSIYILL